MNAVNISKAIISLYDPEQGDVITNLKLQKLLYYTQGFNLAAFKKPLFDDKIYAWQYGPVVKAAYDQYKDNGSSGIILNEEVDVSSLFGDKDQLNLFLEVNEVYGQFSAVRLMNMTHDELPWRTTKINEEITHDKLIEYFATQLER